jgi:hypothetical protein
MYLTVEPLQEQVQYDPELPAIIVSLRHSEASTALLTSEDHRPCIIA